MDKNINSNDDEELKKLKEIVNEMGAIIGTEEFKNGYSDKFDDLIQKLLSFLGDKVENPYLRSLLICMHTIDFYYLNRTHYLDEEWDKLYKDRMKDLTSKIFDQRKN